jgi:hypothetical protein
MLSTAFFRGFKFVSPVIFRTQRGTQCALEITTKVIACCARERNCEDLYSTNEWDKWARTRPPAAEIASSAV